MSNRAVLGLGNREGSKSATGFQVGRQSLGRSHESHGEPLLLEGSRCRQGRASVSSNRLAGRFRWFWLVAPFAAEELTATMFGDHRRHPHHTHDEKNREEDNCNHEDWHTAPLAPLCVAVELASVTAITGGCEEGLGGQDLSECTSCDVGCQSGPSGPRSPALFQKSGASAQRFCGLLIQGPEPW